MMKNLLYIFLSRSFLFLLLFIYACNFTNISSEERNTIAQKNEGNIIIGVVESSDTINLYRKGVQLAIQQINENGGVLGRFIQAIYYDDKGSKENALKIADKLSGNSDVVAVIGHNASQTAIPVSITYENSGILFITSGSTHRSFIQFTDKYSFRNVPSDADIGKSIVHFLKKNKLKRVISLFDTSSYKRGLSEAFHETALENGLKLVKKKAYMGKQPGLREILAGIKKDYVFDVLFITGLLSEVSEIITQARQLGILEPIISDFTLDSIQLFNISEKYAENTIVSTIFDPNSLNQKTINYVIDYREEYGVNPDTWSALGYDAVRLIEHSINKGKSSAPLSMSGALKFLNNWNGVTGSYSFTTDGDIINKAFFYKKVKNQNFVYLDREKSSKAFKSGKLKKYTIRLPIIGNFQTLDPALISDINSKELAEQLFLNLTDINPKTYESVPELATHWDMSKDEKKYTFYIRKDARWTDGTPVTAHDMVWTIRRNINPKTKSPKVSYLFILKNAVNIYKGIIKDKEQLGVRAINDYCVEFELDKAVSFFPAMTATLPFTPLPKHVIETYKDQWTDLNHIQTNGSYKISKWVKGVKFILHKNEDYYDNDNVSIPVIIFYTIPDINVALTMYRNKDIDIIGDTLLTKFSSSINSLNSELTIDDNFYHKPILSTVSYIFNIHIDPVNHTLVRHAISSAINREVLVKFIGGNNISAKTFTEPTIFDFDNSMDYSGIDFNPEIAKNNLIKAGYMNEKKIQPLKLAYIKSPSNEYVAKSIQTFLKSYLSIDVHIHGLEMEEILNQYTKKSKYHLIQYNFRADYPDANNWLNDCFNPLNISKPIHWYNLKYFELMKLAGQITNHKVRKRIYKIAEEILCKKECVVMPLYHEVINFIVNSRVKGWHHMPIGGQHIRDWYLEE